MSSTSTLSYIIISIAVLYALVLPKWDELSVLRAEESKYQDAILKTQQIEQKKNDLLAKFNEVKSEDRARIESLIPDKYDYVRLVSQIDSIGSRYGISIDKVQSREHDTSVGNSIGEAAPPKIYKSATISFTFNSTYENFNKFMDDLERSLRILDIKSIRISALEGSVYTYDVEIDTYWFAK